MAHQGQKIKEKVKHFFHHDNETTPDASPGYAEETTVQTPTTTTTNVPEAFYPGARPVLQEETHSTIPYTSALGHHELPPQPTSVPSDSTAMLGAPPSGGKPTDASVPDDTGSNPSGEAQAKEVSGVKIEDYPDKESKGQTEDYPLTGSVVESKDINPDTARQTLKGKMLN